MADFTDDILLSAGAQVDARPLLEAITTNGWQSAVDGDIFRAITVSNGSRVSEAGMKPEDILVSNKASIDVFPYISAVTTNGADIILDTYRPQTQFILTGQGVEQTSINEFHMYCLRGAHNVRVDVSVPPGEPGTGSSVTVVMESGDSVELPSSGYPYFYINPLDYGQSVLRVSGGSDGVHTHLTVDVVDRNPNDPLVENGSQITVVASPWIPDKGGISNNNTNNVNLTGYTAFYDDLSISHGVNVNAGKFENIGVAAGAQMTVDGFNPYVSDLKVRTGSRLEVLSSVLFNGSASVSNGSKTELAVGNRIEVANGFDIVIDGSGGIPTGNFSVKNGSRIDTGKGYVIIHGADERVSSGSSVTMTGTQPADISISHHATTHVFRGIQVENSDIFVQNGATVLLTGVAIGGTISDVTVPCEIFTASLKTDYQFVRGQITEIPEISLDSSIKLGVKLYSCSNTLLNVSTFTSAYITFDDELQLPANIDTVSNLIYVLATPADFSVLSRNKVYDMRIHVTDKSGNPSIVLIRKLRFV